MRLIFIIAIGALKFITVPVLLASVAALGAFARGVGRINNLKWKPYLIGAAYPVVSKLVLGKGAIALTSANIVMGISQFCLLYTSDAADE